MPRPQPPISVVHVVAPARYGGLETVVTALTAELIHQGDKVCVAAVLSPGDENEHPFLAALDDVGVDTVRIVVPGRAYHRERSILRDVLKQRQAQLLHTHGYRPDLIDGPVARRMGLPVVSTVHGYTGGGFRNRLNEWLQTRALRRSDAVIAVSSKLKGELALTGVAESRLHTIANAWRPAVPGFSRREARARLGLEDDERVVAWVGRMSKGKGPDLMIRAMAALRDDQIRLSMVGAGAMESECRALADSLGIAGRVTWHGVVEDAGLHLSAFDVVALTSWSEGTPMLLLEAMSAGVPIVTTAVGGIPDVVSEEEALLCDAGDVEQIASAIGMVFADPDAARRRADAARRRLDVEYDVESWARRHRELYSSLINA